MKVFISWSGERSKHVAQHLKDWLNCVIQACDPWVSSRNLDAGSKWLNGINNALSEANIGIICLTSENTDSPWVLFEAGALAKDLDNSQVITFLIDIEPGCISQENPLFQFQACTPNEESMFDLVSSINENLKENKLDETTLRTVFDRNWKHFETDYEKIIKRIPVHETGADVKESNNKDGENLLQDIHIYTRSLSSRMEQIERNIKRIANNSMHSDGSFKAIDNALNDITGRPDPKDYSSLKEFISACVFRGMAPSHAKKLWLLENKL